MSNLVDADGRKTERARSAIRSRFAAARAPYLDQVKALRDMDLPTCAISKRVGISIGMVKSCLADLGLKATAHEIGRRSKAIASARRHLAARAALHADVRRMSDAGYPVNRIAKELGIGRAMVTTCFDDLGIPRPGISLGNRLSAALAGPEARKARAAAAQRVGKAMDVAPVTRAHKARIKRASGFYIGAGEADLCEALRAKGLEPIPQFDWEGYNIDLMLGHLAVEVHATKARPEVLTQRVCRIAELLSAGMSVLYIHCPAGGGTISPAAVDQVVAFHDLTSRNPSAVGQYRVVRSDGEIDHAAGRQLHKLSLVMSRYHALKAG